MLEAYSPRNETVVTLIRDKKKFEHFTPNDVLERLLIFDMQREEANERRRFGELQAKLDGMKIKDVALKANKPSKPSISNKNKGSKKPSTSKPKEVKKVQEFEGTTSSSSEEVSVFGPGRVLSRLVNLCCVFPTLDGDTKRIHGGLSWFEQNKALRPAGKGVYYISLHLSACVGVTSRERGSRSQVSKKEYNGVLLEVLILEVWEMSVLSFFSSVVRRPPGELLALPFYRLKGRIRLTTNPRRCLGGEGEASTIGVAVATCLGACRPSLGRHGDVDDGTAGHPECYSGCAIPCGRCMGRGLLVQLVAVKAGSERG
jgi:hypothetical protein